MKRSEIVKEAEGWAGTKWQHQQARKQVACDCAGLARGVYANLTGTKVEVMDYPATWHLFKKEERLYNTCKEIMTEKKLEALLRYRAQCQGNSRECRQLPLIEYSRQGFLKEPLSLYV